MEFLKYYEIFKNSQVYWHNNSIYCINVYNK